MVGKTLPSLIMDPMDLRQNIYSHVAMQQIPPRCFRLEKYHQQEMDVFFQPAMDGYVYRLPNKFGDRNFFCKCRIGNYMEITFIILNSTPNFGEKSSRHHKKIMVCKNQISQPSPDNPHPPTRHVMVGITRSKVFF